MDQAVENALKRRDELRVELTRLQEELSEAERFLALYEQFSRTAVEHGETPNETRAAHVRRQRRRLTPGEIADIAERLIVDAGTPLTRSQIASRLEERDVRLPGADQVQKARYIGTIMWRKGDRFKNIEGRGYWPLSAGEPALS